MIMIPLMIAPNVIIRVSSMQDRRERNIERCEREKREEEKGEKNMLKRCVRVSRAGSDWSTPLLTPFAPATWLDGSFLLRSRPLFWFIPSSFRELATRCFHGRIGLIVERVCFIYPVYLNER